MKSALLSHVTSKYSNHIERREREREREKGMDHKKNPVIEHQVVQLESRLGNTKQIEQAILSIFSSSVKVRKGVEEEKGGLSE